MYVKWKISALECTKVKRIYMYMQAHSATYTLTDKDLEDHSQELCGVCVQFVRVCVCV